MYDLFTAVSVTCALCMWYKVVVLLVGAELEIMWNAAVMALFGAISHYFHGGIEEKHKNIIQDGWSLD
jgi:hypothetical protein